MAENSVLYQLKILSGISAGACLSLKEGDLVIGSSQECDLILHDAYITDKHMKINVSDEGLTLQALSQPVYVEEQDIGIEKMELKPCQIIQLGGVHLHLEGLQQPCHSLSKVKVQKVPKRKFKPFYLWGGLIVFLLANLVVFFHTNKTVSNVLQRPINEKIHELARDLEIENFSLTQEKNNQISVTGYTASNNQRKLFIEKSHELDETIKTRIWTEEAILKQLRTISDAFSEIHIKYASKQYGEIIATGYASKQDNWTELKRTLLADVTGIEKLDDTNLKMLPDQLKILESQLSQENFYERLEIKLENEHIFVSGELSSEELERWTHIRDRFSEIYLGALTFVENLKDTRDQIKLSIRSVSIGDTPFIVAKDGRKYQEGSHLGDDYYVKSINEHNIVLEHNNMEIPIDYGLHKEGQQL